ncbi:MAG: helix-turn-helix domain containing protein [Terriglobales bacterium]
MPKSSPKQDVKLEALRQQGTLNLRPQTVTDELFVNQEFFDARDLVQVKYEMLRRVEKDGHSISAAAASFGFSRPSFYQAQFAFEEGGLAGLVPLKRGPKKAHKLTPEIIDFLQGERQRDSSLRTLQLAALVEERFHVVVHPRTIERGLARSQKKRLPPE